MRSPYPNRRRRFFFPLFFLVAFLALTGAVYWLWNTVLAAVVPVKTVTYWQAMGLLVLSKILLGGFRFGPRVGGPPYGSPVNWRQRWRNMTDEERAKFRSEWKRRKGGE